jgi:DHA2 family multidrug resistance protein
LQINQQYLVPNLAQTYQPYNTAIGQIQQAFLNTGHSMAQAIAGAPGQVFQVLQNQVSVLAYIDVFRITGFLSLALVPTALLLAGVKAKSAGGEG